MPEPTGRGTARGDLILLSGCVALALLALAMPRTWAAALTAGIRQTALRPVVLLRARAETDRRARFELAGIERSRDSLALLVQEGQPLRQENDNLRKLLGLRPRVSPRALPANVLHLPSPTDSRMLLLDVGSADGVAPFDPVVTADGLLGQIWSVEAHSSAVLTWVHPDFRASAVTADARVLGTLILAPASGGSASHTVLELRGVSLHDALPLGTVVYTSGLGSAYPRGIPVGHVSAVGPEELGYDRIYRVLPFVNPGAATQVMVLTSPHDSLFLPIPAARDTAS